MEIQAKVTGLDVDEQDTENVADFFSDVIDALSLVRGHDEIAGYAVEDYLDEAVSALEAAQSDVLRA
ncbi:hypothetical protein M1M41_gp042 [Halorubrum sodomense tailed virus 4]|uniref:Uncharacterized protein n=1 Tax=Halorubrum sodomense tailed virus 4 TaxID=2878013 RepID=A0AAE9BW13_9CAUD|nr:hypothetical protein M1M41_gp042 [Halorubrum sodomense tailed virus 4]UBF20289.1 hypothetical protein HSTV-4_gp82 [Halorubrum sodomense tailed virus 4]UBF21978.1 hypothetical protein HJTV-3_gp89 [Haloarcula virus HJTV-3]UBF22107.1 hypothetical protein HRTV-15_gp88 [Halorubrum virus HRTV-15]